MVNHNSSTSSNVTASLDNPSGSLRSSSVPAYGVIGIMSAMCLLAVAFVAYGLFSRAEAIKEEPDLTGLESHNVFFDLDCDYDEGGGFSTL